MSKIKRQMTHWEKCNSYDQPHVVSLTYKEPLKNDKEQHSLQKWAKNR